MRARATTNFFIKSLQTVLMCFGQLCTAESSPSYVRHLMFPEYLGIIQTNSPPKTMIVALAVAPPGQPACRSLSLVFCRREWKPVDC
jgi:hypothetical protein